MATRYDDMLMSPDEAAKLLRMSPQTIKLSLQRGDFPFGHAIQGRGEAGRTRYSYIISRKAVENFLSGKSGLGV